MAAGRCQLLVPCRGARGLPYLGKEGIGPREIERLRSAPSPAEKLRLVKDARFRVFAASQADLLGEENSSTCGILSPEKPISDRYSRHYYDVAMLAQRPIRADALARVAESPSEA
jgi:hypothetical protein